MANKLLKNIDWRENISRTKKIAQRQKAYNFQIENIYIPVPKYTPFNMLQKRSWENKSSICSFPKTA